MGLNVIEDKFTILLIADNFDPHFAPITYHTPWAKVNLASIQLLDLSLNWISLINAPLVPNIVVVSSTLTNDDLAEFTTKWSHNFKSFRAFHLKDCNTVGKIMRAVEKQSILEAGHDFMLIENLATFCSSNLAAQIEAFRNCRKKDKHCIMSILYSRQISGEIKFVGYETESQKLLFYQGSSESPSDECSTRAFLTKSTVRSDLAPCGVVLCAWDVVAQFVDNFDFDQFDQVVREVLVNEDVLCYTMNVDVLPEDVVAFTAADYGSFLRAQRLLIHRWCYPLTYDRLPPRVMNDNKPLRYHRNHVYVPHGSEGPATAEGSVIGNSCKIDQKARLEDVTLGAESEVAAYATLKSVIAGNGLIVGVHSHIEGAFIGNNVKIGSKCTIRAKTVIGSNVTIPDGTTVASNSAVMNMPAPETNDDVESRRVNEGDYYTWKLLDEPSGHFWRRSHSFTRMRRQRHASTVSSNRLSISIDSTLNAVGTDNDRRSSSTGGDGTPMVDYGLMSNFAAEVKDSIAATFESTNNAGETELKKLILEINASKLAHNASPIDVAKSLFGGFISLPPFEDKDLGAIKELFGSWELVWENYYRSRESKLQILHSLEEAASINDNIRVLVPNLIHHLYLEWDDFTSDIIYEWYEGLPPESPIRLSKNMAQLLAYFRAQDDDDDEDDDDDDDDDESGEGSTGSSDS